MIGDHFLSACVAFVRVDISPLLLHIEQVGAYFLSYCEGLREVITSPTTSDGSPHPGEEVDPQFELTVSIFLQIRERGVKGRELPPPLHIGAHLLHESNPRMGRFVNALMARSEAYVVWM